MELPLSGVYVVSTLVQKTNNKINEMKTQIYKSS